MAEDSLFETLQKSFNDNFGKIVHLHGVLGDELKHANEKVQRLEKELVDVQARLDKEVELSLERHETIATLRGQLSASDKTCVELKEKMQAVAAENSKLAQENNNFTYTMKSLEQEIGQLKRNIEMLEDERRQFTKVSHIIALEKENTKLRIEIEKLKTKPAETKQIVQHEVVDSVPSPISEEQNAVVEEEESIDVYEKVIKGNTYYVSNKEDKTIYEKLEDGSIGNKVGTIVKSNGRSKVEWCS